MKREQGFYWVKLNESRDWEIAFWWGECWLFPGFTTQIKQVFEIDERRIERRQNYEDLQAAFNAGMNRATFNGYPGKPDAPSFEEWQKKNPENN